MEFTQRVRDVLSHFGWDESRKVDVSKEIQALVDEGYSIFPFAKQVVENLEGILIGNKREGYIVDFFCDDGGELYHKLAPWMDIMGFSFSQ